MNQPVPDATPRHTSPTMIPPFPKVDALREPHAYDLKLFMGALVPLHAWVGTIAGLPGLFFTPNAPARVTAEDDVRYRTGHRPLHERAEVPQGYDGGLDTLFVEGDRLPVEEQIRRIELLGVPPTAMVLSGDKRHGVQGRSVHAFWRLTHRIPYSVWREYQLALVGALEADPCVLCPWQAMRVGGFWDALRCQTLLSASSYIVLGDAHHWIRDPNAIAAGVAAEERSKAWRAGGGGLSEAAPGKPLAEYLQAYLRDRGWKFRSFEGEELWVSPHSGQSKPIDDAVDDEEEIDLVRSVSGRG